MMLTSAMLFLSSLLLLLPCINGFFISRQQPYRAGSVSLSAKRDRVRIDDLLVEEGLAESRDQAQRLVLARSVLIREGEVVQSPALLVDRTDSVRVRGRGDSHGFVARSALKLVRAVEAFGLQPRISNALCIDIGSSTGGFTEVLLRNHARAVYAVDVGVSILAYKLRVDPRVRVLERVNARLLSQEHVPEAGAVEVVVCDVSFISLRLVLPPAMEMCAVGAVVCALIKPQFECERSQLEEGGIVRDEATRRSVVDSIQLWFQQSFPTWAVNGTIESPITGTHGNQEYLLVATKLS